MPQDAGKVATSSSARKVLPKRLEEELSALNIPRYKAKGPTAPAASLADIMDDSMERAMYDQILGPLINRRPTSGTLLTRSRPTSLSQASQPGLFDALPVAGAAAAGDGSFNCSVLTRLASVEAENKDLRRQLAEKVVRIDTIERENRQLTRQLEASSSSSSAKARDLVLDLEESRLRGLELEGQIKEMEKFLADYGLVWVGSQQQQEEQLQRQQEDDDEQHGFHEAGEEKQQPGVDFHAFSLKVQELNNLIAAEPAQVKVEARRARLMQASEAAEHIPLAFYRNGLMIRRGPFRANGSSSYASFTRDILDGFFPSEFRASYPDGVILELRDRHLEDYCPESEAMSAAQLIRRMPKAVIRNGQVVEMRDAVDRMIGSTTVRGPAEEGRSRAGIVVLTTPAASASPSLIAFVTVQVRWVDGSTLQAKMFPGDIVGDVREHIRRHFATSAGAAEEVGFELRAAYPPRLLADSMTLDEAGLVPTGVVHARRVLY